jgi:hypothetical protein
VSYRVVFWCSNGALMEDFQNLFRTTNITSNLDHCGLPNGLGGQYTAYSGW